MESLVDVLYHVGGMSWKIAWALVLGFAISGVIQAFVSKQRVAEHLGSFGLRPLSLATGFGAASSSCSYAAAAMSKTLFQKGAHITNATAFLFASTNLVLEIGLVIWTLLGWRFVAAEFFGGVVLILVVALLLKWFLPRRLVGEARGHLDRATDAGGHEHDHGDETLPWSKLLTREGIAAAGSYFATDWRMIFKDVVIGVAVAGALHALVPMEWWRALFLADAAASEPSFWIQLENAVVGPLVAVISFVCSVGNIPLAAVLWAGGATFGGVIAFIFADLITIPMILVYRRYYGWKVALVYSLFLFAAMVLTALGVDALFQLIGLAPRNAEHARQAMGDYFAWDYTTFLNLVFIPLGLLLFWYGSRHSSHHTHRDHHGGEHQTQGETQTHQHHH